MDEKNKLFGNWEAYPLDAPVKYARFAKAYLSSALSLCINFENDTEPCYEKGCVILYLAQHSVELFLKGAILSKKPLEQLNKHNINELKLIYSKTFKGSEYNLYNPFKIFLRGYKAADKERKNEIRANIDKLRPETYRYPLDKKQNKWKIAHAFNPISSLHELKQLEKSFDNLIPKIFQDIYENRKEI